MSDARPLLLLLPGLMCDAGVWRAQIAAFEGAYEVRIPDFFGLDSFDAMTEAALALADRPCALAGHSMGGRVAMQAAAAAPERVLRLALLDTAANLTASGEAERRMGLVKLGERQGIEAVVEAWLPPMLASGQRANRALWDEVAAMLRRAGVETLRGQQNALLNRGDGFAQLDTVKVPTAFIVGAEDAWSPPQQHREMKAHVPGSALTVIDGCGHMAPMEAPEAVNRALAQWLETQ
ncbi:MAG TPA: alpha/beta fold hydrolase [Caulobacteraceae bacterium]|jgi:pimeloyl-ACP methyl ester carboxylesterase